MLIDPNVLAAVSWVGLFVTIGGFWVAIAQIRKVNAAASAAKLASNHTLTVIRERLGLTDITMALGHIDTILSHIANKKYEVAAVFLGLLKVKLISIRESDNNDSGRSQISQILIDLDLVLNQLHSGYNGIKDADIPDLLRAFSPVADALNERGARLRFGVDRAEIGSINQ